MHPGGRGFDTLPVNDFEAERRRLARFERLGHTGGTMTPAPATVHPDFPHTLDLRRYGPRSPSCQIAASEAIC